MKAKKQRKIAFVQLETISKKLLRLQYKKSQIVKQVTPLKITVRKYIQQNAKELEIYQAQVMIMEAKGRGMLNWAVDKIKRGYFADANMKNLQEIILAITWFEKWKAKQHQQRTKKFFNTF